MSRSLDEQANLLLYGSTDDPFYARSKTWYRPTKVKRFPKLRLETLVSYQKPKSAGTYRGKECCCVDCHRPKSVSSGKRCLSCFRKERRRRQLKMAERFWAEKATDVFCGAYDNHRMSAITGLNGYLLRSGDSFDGSEA